MVSSSDIREPVPKCCRSIPAMELSEYAEFAAQLEALCPTFVRVVGIGIRFRCSRRLADLGASPSFLGKQVSRQQAGGLYRFGAS